MSRLSAGDRLPQISARRLSNSLACGDAWAGSGRAGANGPGPTDDAPNPGRVRVLNTTGVAGQRGEIVGLDDPTFDANTAAEEAAALGCPIHNGVVPQWPRHLGRWAVWETDTAPDSWGWAYTAGVCWARVSITSTGHRYCDFRTGQVTLYSRPCGSAAIVAPGGIGWTWSQIRIGPPMSEFWARLSETVDPDEDDDGYAYAFDEVEHTGTIWQTLENGLASEAPIARALAAPHELVAAGSIVRMQIVPGADHESPPTYWFSGSTPPAALTLWELVDEVTIPSTAGQAPQAQACPVVWDEATDTYAVDLEAGEETIYFPGAPRRADGQYCYLPLGITGDRFWCRRHDGGFLEVVDDLSGPYLFEIGAASSWTYSANADTPPQITAWALDRSSNGVYGHFDSNHPETLVFPSAPRRYSTNVYYHLPAYVVYGHHHAVWKNGVFEVIDTPRWRVTVELYQMWTYPTSAPLCPYSEGAHFLVNPIDRTLGDDTLTVYNPLALYDSTQSKYIGLPRGRNGQRIQCEYDVGKCLWYCVEAFHGPWKGVLYERLNPGSYAMCDVPASGTGSVRVRVDDDMMQSPDYLESNTTIYFSYFEQDGKLKPGSAYCQANVT